MTSAAERYAAAVKRNQYRRLADFRTGYPFGLDDFQEQACSALEDGRSVLVAAPTGAGKTVVGEFAVYLALQSGTKCFYTTPIKALSNQKFNELVRTYGEDKIGLLTGDNSINGDADVVVMTTEVLRNMLYAQSDSLHNLDYVVMDEVHYLADRFRGAVWEEVIIHLPERVQVAALSATVSNAEEFGAWLRTVRGDTDIVVEEHRPVPLWQHVMADRTLYDLFVDDDQTLVNPELVDLARVEQRRQRPGKQHRRRGGPRSSHTPFRSDVIERLNRDRLLPVIYFIFSRAGCDAAVRQCVDAGLRLTSRDAKAEIERRVAQRTADIPAEDLAILGYGEWLEGLGRGFASHHAGLLPTFKEIVEELFQDGLVPVVFATETLALGINMPARSVVLERLVKWNGETHVDITAGEYTQLTGRAGRRGIDVEGHGVVLWYQDLDPAVVAGLASARTYPLRSSFAPSYNMAVNLVSRLGYHAARDILETSFAQFQADQAVVGLARQMRKNESALEAYRESMQCQLGDMAEYARLRQELSDREKSLVRHGNASRKAEVVSSLEQLRAGDIIVIPTGRRVGPVVVLDPGLGNPNEPRPLVLTLDRQVRRLSTAVISAPVESVGRLKIPKHFSSRNPSSRRDVSNALKERLATLDWESHVGKRRTQGSDDDVISELRARLRAHPCHGCNDREDHARWAERYRRLEKENNALEARIKGRTNTIARQFDRVCVLLSEMGYLNHRADEWSVTESGRMLMGMYSESDLLAAECLRAGIWNECSAVQLAAVCSSLVSESRRADEDRPPKIPGDVRETLADMVRLWVDIEEKEKAHKVEFTREPDFTMVWAAYRWASGSRLATVLSGTDMTAGDFVRSMKMLIDVLGQLSNSAPEPVASRAHEAASLLTRGVVAYSSISE